MTKINKCSCSHEEQDKLYGKGLRLMKLTQKGNDSKKVYRCTVCNKESN
jgi:hypothetical protein